MYDGQHPLDYTKRYIFRERKNVWLYKIIYFIFDSIRYISKMIRWCMIRIMFIIIPIITFTASVFGFGQAITNFFGPAIRNIKKSKGEEMDEKLGITYHKITDFAYYDIKLVKQRIEVMKQNMIADIEYSKKLLKKFIIEFFPYTVHFKKDKYSSVYELDNVSLRGKKITVKLKSIEPEFRGQISDWITIYKKITETFKDNEELYTALTSNDTVLDEEGNIKELKIKKLIKNLSEFGSLNIAYDYSIQRDKHKKIYLTLEDMQKIKERLQFMDKYNLSEEHFIQ